MRKRLTVLVWIFVLCILSACSFPSAGHTELPEQVTAAPVSREMVDLVRGIRGKS